MSRLDIMTPSHAQTVIDGLYRDVERRIAASPPGQMCIRDRGTRRQHFVLHYPRALAARFNL